MIRRLFATENSGALFFMRVVLGLVMLPHGAQKVLGWWGGHGWTGTMSFFTGMGLPTAVAALVILGESLGALGLIAGLATRLAALGIAAIMIGAIALVHWPIGFFMNWTGQAAGEGFEFHLLALGLALPLMVKGAGRWSIDRWIAGQEPRSSARARVDTRPRRAA